MWIRASNVNIEHEHRRCCSLSIVFTYFSYDGHCRYFIIIHCPTFNKFIVSHGIERVTIRHDADTSNESIVCRYCCFTCSLSDIPKFDLDRMTSIVDQRETCTHCVYVDCQSFRTSPSHEPDRSNDSWVGCFATHCTLSRCPSKLQMNGRAKMRSIFTAFIARVYSRAVSNGWSSGS
jgi:hypothetical protein